MVLSFVCIIPTLWFPEIADNTVTVHPYVDVDGCTDKPDVFGMPLTHVAERDEVDEPFVHAFVTVFAEACIAEAKVTAVIDPIDKLSISTLQPLVSVECVNQTFLAAVFPVTSVPNVFYYLPQSFCADDDAQEPWRVQSAVYCIVS